MEGTRYERVAASLTNQTPTAVGVARIERVRSAAKELALQMDACCPDSRESSLAFTKLEETVMWAVKSIVLEG